MSFRPGITILMVMTVLVMWIDSESCFVDTAEIKGDHSGDKSEDSSESTEDNREKKSGEEIMFGNQQNKANGFMEDMMGMSKTMNLDESTEDADSKNDTEKKGEDDDDDETKLEEALQDEDKKDSSGGSSREEMGNGGSHVGGAWYNNAPISEDTLQYLLNKAPLQALFPVEDANTLYDQEEVYRRKRQLGSGSSLRKRSLRSPVGQMIQTRGRRLPRRSMRYKRQVDIDELLSLLGNSDVNNVGRFYDEQVPAGQNPVHFRESPYRYPFNKGRNEEEPTDAESDDDSKEELPNSLLYSPPARFYEPSDFSLPYSSKSEETEFPSQYPEFIERAPQPSIFTVSRRSTPLFYPLDYRYIPGYKKKRSMSSGREEQDSNIGKWGRVVQSPNAYATAEDVARLYALANLLAESEGPEERTRRSV